MSMNNAASGALFPMGPIMGNANPVKIRGSNLTTIGSNDIYTVPAGKKCVVGAYTTSLASFHSGAGTTTAFVELKVSGTYYRISSNWTIGAGASSGSGSIPSPIVLNAGESISINIDTADLNVLFNGIEYDANNSNIIAGRVLTLSNGNNTIYTVSSGKNAIPWSYLRGTTTSFGYANDSGGALNYISYFVPSGGTPDATNQLVASASLADNSANGIAQFGSMTAGDFIVVNTSAGTATQSAWGVFVEV